MSQQLVKKGTNGKHENVMPKSWIEAIKDKNTGQTLVEVLQGFNMYFLSYNGNTSSTRCLVPTILRKKGLWITYVKYDGNVYTEWYAANEIDDKSWGDSSNWRIGNNTLVGDITISANGNWVINGTETEFKAVGEKGNTPLIRVANNRLQVSYDLGDTYMNVTENPVYTQFRNHNNKIQVSTDLGATWTDASDEIAAYFRWQATAGDTQANNVGRVQISRDNKTWVNLSNDIINNLHISRYIGVSESLPTSGIAEGTIYAKGPYYAEGDTLNENPIYRLWVYAWKDNTLAWQDNGEFTSIAAGVVQETGNSETEVMSQKAVSKKLFELGSEVDVVKLSVDKIEKSLNLTQSGVGYSVPVKIKSGIPFSVKIIADNVLSDAIQNPLYINDSSLGVYKNVANGETVSFVCDFDVENLYLYVKKDSFLAEGDIVIEVKDENSITQRVAKSENDIIRVESKLYSESTFSLNPNYTHSSQGDKVLINIKEGDSFFVEIEMESYVWGQIFAYYADGSNAIIQVIESASVTYEKVADKDIVAVSLFTEKGEGNVSFKVWNKNSITQTLIENSSEIQNNKRGVKYGFSKFTVSNTAGHSSDTDLIYINIQKGEEFYVDVQMTNFIYNEIYAFYEDGSKVSIKKNSTQTSDIYKFIASSNIIALALYVMPTETEVVFSVEKRTLLNKHTDEEITEIKKEITEVNGYISFDVKEGVNHSSRLDLLPVSVTQGQDFIVNIDIPYTDQFWQLHVYSKDDESQIVMQSLGSLKNKKITAPFDIVSVGLYVDGKYSSSVKFEVLTGWRFDVQNTLINDDIVSLNGGKIELQARFSDLRKHYGVYGNPTYGNKPCNIIFTSDAHNAINNLQRIIQFRNEFADYIDDMLHGGDVVQDQFVDDNPLAKIDGGEKVLNTIGNHDNWDSHGATDVTINQRVPQKYVYDKFFAPYISGWGVVQPVNAETDGYCYYYKDYAESKMRLIILDCMNWNTHQSSWLSLVLDSAINDGYHVLICNHYAPNANLHGIRECGFESIYSDDSVFGHDNSLPNEVAELVQSKIVLGLHFIAWIFGHYHQDKFGYLDDYPNQHYIAVDKTAGGQTWERDSSRLYGKAIDGFDIISVDTTFEILTIMRIGENRDKFMRHKNYLTYDYKNSKILANS